MEHSAIREGLQTALMLAKVTSVPHQVKIHGVGVVRLSKKSASLYLPQKGWKKLSEHNLEKCLQGLLKEPADKRSERQTSPLAFSIA